MTIIGIVGLYVIVGCLLAFPRAPDIASEATGLPIIPVIARWVLTWPLWRRGG